MVLLPALLFLWAVPLSSGESRLRKFYLREAEMQINDALNACRSEYTDLVTIYNDNENTGLARKINSYSNNCGWIGANSCTWSNGEPVTFINFTRNFTEERCCGALTTGGSWECFNCSSTKMYFMCYEQDYGQQSFNYRLIPENKTWFEAQLHCRENHTDLVSIRNETENERVKEAVDGSNSVWIGLQYNYSFAWFDGGRSDYKNNTKILDNKHSGCFTFFSKDDELYSWYKANLKTCAALCYKSFIHVSSYKMSWEKALDYCNNHQKTAGLLRMESEDDQIEMERELKRQNISGPVWVGLRQSRLFGFWIWSNGLHVGPWTNWKEGSTPEHQMSQHCGAIEKVDGTFKWSDKDCRSEFRVLCEVK